ncbi:MAG TPA: hypothetical protein VMG98_08410 [Verrucomicrobiae bacterium]|nr:hypothetical protein [Verrucomicrobiae bacterium]
MKRFQHRLFCALLLVAGIAACSGTQTVYTSPTVAPSSGLSSTVSFLVIVPAATTTTRVRRNVVVPSNATSVKFTIDSVNGTPYSGAATTETLAASNSACQVVSGQLSCAFNLSAPVGTIVYTVTIYDGTSVIAEGNVSVTTTAGRTVNAPVTLSGTVAKIVLSVGSGIEGIATTYPVTVQAEDSNGNTILGTYTSPITLTDTDASGQTSIATAGSDDPPGGELLSSSDTATLTYKGGTMSAAATIGASASGVSSSNVTNASFQPTSNYLAQSGSVTLGITYESSTYNEDTVATASPNPTSTSYPVAIATGQTFNGVSNVVGVSGQLTSSAINMMGISSALSAPTASPAVTYYDWSISAQGNGAADLGLVGYSDTANGSAYSLAVTYEENPVESLVQTCAAPYAQILVVPFPATWNVYSGSGSCTTNYMDVDDEIDAYVYASNGSYTDSFNTLDCNSCYLPPGTSQLTVDASGNATYTLDTNAYLGGTCCGSGTIAVAAPSPGASTVAVTLTAPATGPPLFLPSSPGPTTAPNPWMAIGLSSGTPPNPLLSDTMTSKGTIGALPAACAVESGLVPASSPPLTEVDESIVAADPMSNWMPLYLTETIKHYYLNGVGEICNENQTTADYFDFEGYTEQWYGNEWFWTWNQLNGSAIAWYLGVDDNWDSYYSDTYTYITATTLQAVQARVRDFTKVMPTATEALTAATYAMARAPLRMPVQRRAARHRTTWAWTRSR